jgi:hypothetical protein
MDQEVAIPFKPAIKRVRFTHDAVIDEILMDPAVSQGDLAKMFGFTQAWMSIIVNSDAFKERLAERKGELVDPAIRASIAERLDAVAKRSLDKIMERLDSPASGAIKNADLVAMARLGVGDKNTRTPGPALQQNNLYVVALPSPANNSADWVANLSQTPRPLPFAQRIEPGV